MNIKLKERFAKDWNRYFPGAELPIGFFCRDSAEPKTLAKPSQGHRCIFADLVKVRRGKTVCFDVDAVGCSGGKRYLGFTGKARPDLPHFLSCGIPGKLDGERYKKSPALVKELMKIQKPFKAPGQHIIFTRWDNLAEDDNPLLTYSPPERRGFSGMLNVPEAMRNWYRSS